MASAVYLLGLFMPLLSACSLIDSDFGFSNAKHPPLASRGSTLPGNWTLQGCFTDNNGGLRTLNGKSFTSTTNMTQEGCTTFCDGNSFVFAGLEYAQECYCGNVIENGGENTTFTDCNMSCTGNHSESCGGPNRLDFFWNGQTPPLLPITLPSFDLWRSLGCYTDSVAARTLSVGMPVQGLMTVQNCLSACLNAGFSLGGVEFGAECYCGEIFENSGTPVADGCNMPCAGNSSELCGGPSRLNVYNFTGVVTTPPSELPPPPPPPPPPSGGGILPSGGPSPVTSGLPGTWTYFGCYIDNAHGRALGDQLPDSSSVTVESCVGNCSAANYSVAGLEFGVQCFCDNEIINGGIQSPNQDDCNMGCGGNPKEACGAGNRLSVYSSSSNITMLPVPVAQNTSLPGHWQYQGCLAEPATRVFPHQIIIPRNNSAEVCLNRCAAFGYPAAGMEYGDECWCGDVEDIQANGGTIAPETDCNVLCPGNPRYLCGGGFRLQLYTWQGPPMNVWHTPAVTGHYEMLIGGVIVPLLATLGINNKVTFLEKFGTGPPNSTGAYELDVSLANNFSLAWRAMHVKTDVFCSASVVLPDRSGRQLNIGGWSLESTFGVRFYAPSGSPGVNGTTDWEENFQEVHLQTGRWYPSSMIMANGSVLVVGGEAGSNGAPVPTLEILPTPSGGSTVVYLDFLKTDPYNLYPFLMVLQSGIFIIYYNEARILDETTFATIKTFPIIPGGVELGETGGRTYPLEGATVMLPQYAPYEDPVEILTCGGSTPGPGLALDNCVRIAPETPNASWLIERMPFKRVMPCITALPDGTYLILNGAAQGVAGFGLASRPVLTAVLYDPAQPIGQRMSILNTTTVARLYHSETVLLQDGRVLISGSDPNPNGPFTFPEEYRVEVYVPPYLAEGQTQPTFNITVTDWDYGGQYPITNVVTYQGKDIRVSLLGAVSSTHGNNFGQRTLFPDVSCEGSTCTITAPPNAHVAPPGWFQLFVLDGSTPSWSQWVRIGGDPAQLGNWPNFPDFTLPGV